MSKPIPKSVRIGSQVWEVSEQKRKHSADSTHFGFTNEQDSAIVLDSELSLPMKRTTLVHELLHAVRTTFGGSYTPPKGTSYEDWEHYWIGLYEEPLVMVLRDNPELVEFLLGSDD